MGFFSFRVEGVVDIQQLKDIARDANFLGSLDETRANWIRSHTGCGCNNVKVSNFILTVCKKEFDAFCQLRGIV